MSDAATAAAGGVAVLTMIVGAQRVRSRWEGSRAISRLGVQASQPRQRRRALLGGVAARFETTRLGSRLSSYASRAHPGTPFSDILAIAMLGVIGGWVAGSLLFGSGPLVIFCAIGGPVVADRVALKMSGRRSMRVEQALPEALALQASALRAGHSMVRSLRTMAEETPGPLGELVGSAVREIDLGRPVDEALRLCSARAGSRDVELWVTAMLVHRITGGNLASIVESLGARVRDRAQVRAEVRALTAQGRLSGLVVALAPVAFFVVLSMTSREQMSVLYSTPLGLLLLAVGLVMEVAGYLWIRWILRIKA